MEKILDFDKDWEYVKETQLSFLETDEQRESMLKNLMIAALYN